jgi:5-methylcytosine-specific restriction endonuclease McrA
MPYKNPQDKKDYDRELYKNSPKKRAERKARVKKWVRNNSARHKKNKKEWAERNVERTKKWRHDNKDKLTAQKRLWIKKNLEKYKRIKRAYRKAHPEAHRLEENKRRAHIAGNGGVFTVTEWKDLCQKYAYKCLRCKRRRKLTADHVIPISEGGTNNIDNIQPLCGPCNSSKGTKCTDYR